MKSLLLFFLFILPAISFAQTTSELEQEIETLLQDRHHYQGRGFFKSFFDRAEDGAYLEGLKKFKQALEKTQHIRDFSNIDLLFITSRKKNTTFLNSKGRINFSFSAQGPAESFIALLSNDPKKESEYQKYLKKVDEEKERRLQEKYGPWYKFHKAGQKILCNHGVTDDKKNTVAPIIEQMTGKKITDVRYTIKGSSKKIIILPESPPPSRIEIHTLYKDQKALRSYIQIKRKGFFFANQKKLIHSWFDSDCNFEEGQIWEYNSKDLLWKRQSLDANGETQKTIFSNRDVKSLDEIYGPCKYERPFSELEDIAKRIDRILVSVLDSGVDYNHPDIAFKIPRPSSSNSKVIRALQKEKKDLEKEYNKLGVTLRWQDKHEYQSKIYYINYKIEKESALGWDYDDDDAQPYDYYNYENISLNIEEYFDHGTHVAGIVSEGSDDIAILPIRYSRFKPSRFYDAIELAHERGSRIVNISLASHDPRTFKFLSRAIVDHPNMLFVVASGNSRSLLNKTPIYPASYDHPNMIVVASVDENNELSDFSNYSQTKVDIAAPGEDIYSLEPENSYGRKSGTSMATAYTTRIAAKIKFINPSLTPLQIIAIIRNSSTPIESLRDKVKYGGVVNEEKAIQMAQESRLISDNIN